MKERPILFSGEMVRAILDNRKTQTRRVVKPQPIHRAVKANDGTWYDADCINPGKPIKYHYGQPGDRLWVREAFRLSTSDDCACYDPCSCKSGVPIYRASVGDDSEQHWTPSIHMPRLASRINLEIVAVRVERLQEIGEEGSIAEGVDPPRCPRCGYTRFDCSFQGDHRLCPHDTPPSAIPVYAKLWDAIYAKTYPWSSNPFVWVVEFRRIQP